MHGLRAAADKRVPVIERGPLGAQLIGACARQPIHVVCDGFGRQHDAFGHKLMADVILAALTGFPVKQAARHAGGHHLAGVFVFKFVQTAFTATVTQRFPFFGAERGQRLFPKRLRHRPEFRGLWRNPRPFG